MARVQGSPPWSDLPPELLGLVFLRLPTRAFFPAVCRTWCSAASQSRLPPPSPVPWIVQPSAGTVTSLFPGETFRFPDGVRYHTSCGEWLVLTRDDDSCFMMNPFTTATMPLPSLSSYSYYEHPVELGDGSSMDTTALFDGIEEGWIRIRAPAYSSREIHEQENDQAMDSLHDRVTVLKRLTGDIHEEVENHNRMLDSMGNDVDASRGFLSETVDKLKMVFETK